MCSDEVRKRRLPVSSGFLALLFVVFERACRLRGEKKTVVPCCFDGVMICNDFRHSRVSRLIIEVFDRLSFGYLVVWYAVPLCWWLACGCAFFFQRLCPHRLPVSSTTTTTQHEVRAEMSVWVWVRGRRGRENDKSQ